MRRIFQIIAFVKSFATGVMIPVLALALMAHGASISTISLLLGAYSFTVIVAEFPSGVFADLCGRKKAFLLSTVFYVACYGILLFSQSIVVLFCAMVANGLGRAFSSGSIDALAIDDAVASGGEVAKATAQLSILESAGLAAGALAGGLLSAIGSHYEGNLIVNGILYVLLFLLALLCVREHVAHTEHTAQVTGVSRIRAQVRESISFMAQKGLVRMLFVLTFITGFALLSVETYWQPALLTMSPASWLFGAVSFAGFFCVILGSKAIERLLLKQPEGGTVLLLILKALLGGCLVLLVSQFQAPFFIGVYMLAYLFLGGGSVAENTLLNQAAPASQRASILSLFSFVLQIGGLLASLIGYVVSAQTNFRNMWLIGGALLLIGAGASALVYAKQRRRVAENRQPELPVEKQEEAATHIQPEETPEGILEAQIEETPETQTQERKAQPWEAEPIQP